MRSVLCSQFRPALTTLLPIHHKDVASVMRLPGSINTKPDRNGAAVQITDWYSDWRYPLYSQHSHYTDAAVKLAACCGGVAVGPGRSAVGVD